MLSFWEQKYFLHYDYVIIGSGIVGLTTAFYLKQKFESARILILERGIFPTGASTKNAGFACMGSATELLADLKSMSEQEVYELFELRQKGLQRLQTILSKDEIGYQSNGSYELIAAQEIDVIDELKRLNQWLKPLTKTDAFVLANEKINVFGFNANHVAALIENTCEGEINTGLMMQNLLSKVLKLGIEIKTGCEVRAIVDNENTTEIICKNPLDNMEISFKANKVFVCNNAFATQLIPELDVKPGRGQVLITKPIPDLKFKGIFHMQEGFYYFREFENCVLFGGGRNLDFEKETTQELSLNTNIQNDLIEKLSTIILPKTNFEIDHQWAGIMAFGNETKSYILKQHSSNVFVGVRMNGMGIAIGSEVGFQLSELI